MLLWFVGMAVALVWSVFRSPAVDYRMVALGAVLPLADAITGGPFVLHTLAGSVALLAAVMLATRRRRLVRRRWLGVPIGTFLHLVLDATWSRTSLFWWPLLGTGALDGSLPEADRPVAVIVVLELAGVAALVWAWRRFGLDDPGRRARLLRSGRLGEHGGGG